MLRKTLAGVVLVLGLCYSAFGHALSLGELSQDSALNQPFRAEIPIRDAGNLGSDQIVVRLASTQDFERVGVEYTHMLTRLNFEVEMHGDGTGRVLINTRERVVEPYLNFIVEARWPTGRMLREYTVLLDLPAMTDERAPRMETIRGGVASQTIERQEHEPQEVVIEEAPRRRPALRDPEERRRLPEAEAGGEYRVQHNDTLWEVAMRARPSGDVTVQQTMLALQRNNSEAFIDGNINRLKSGYVLRLPSEEEVKALTQEQAVREVSRQNDVWRGRIPATEVAPAEEAPVVVDREEPAPIEEVEPEVAPRLSIAAPGEADMEGAVEAGVAASLRDRLAVAEEERDRAERERAEMTSRVRDLEEQMATLQRLLELRDEQLAALQGETAERAAEQPPAGVEITGIDNRNLLYAAVAAVVLLLLVLLMRFQRQRQARAREQALEDVAPGAAGAVSMRGDAEVLTASRDEPEEPEFEAARYEDVAEEEERTDDQWRQPADDTLESYDLDELMASPADERSSRGAGYATSEESEADDALEPETGDAVAEAEIYMAYGRYEQAAQLLKNAIEREPERSDLRVKLLDIYLETRDREKFMEAYRELKALGDDNAISEVKESMSAVEGVSEWLREEEPDLSVDGDSPVARQPAAGSEDAAVEDWQLDEAFELDDAASIENPEPEKAPEDVKSLSTGDSAAEDELGDLEFSLEDLEEDSKGPGAETLSLEAEEQSTEGGPLELEQDEPQSETGALEFSLDDLDLDDEESAPLADELDTKEEKASDGGFASGDAEALDFDLDTASEEEDSEALLSDEDPLDFAIDAEEAATERTEQAGETEQADRGADELSGERELTLDTGEEQGAESEPAPASARKSEEQESQEQVEFGDSFEDAADEELDDLGLLGESDEVSTKLDLARAYIDMGDSEGARDMLQEVLDEGDEEQKREAGALLERL